MKRLLAVILAFAAACAEVPIGPEPIKLDFPEIQRFKGESPGPAARPNSEIALDFIDLAFRMESGRELPRLTRFEGPITVRVVGRFSQTTLDDLTALLRRLRTEARIDISLTNDPEANIVIEAVPNRTLQRVAPNAACFVVPRVQTWGELRAARNSPVINWATLESREKAAIFIPSDVTPQEIRDCLHEELAQALGPLNDLYRLPDSVFNDDNIHAVLTGFDMLILRAYYDPELRNGMTKQQVAQRLPGILGRLNRRGQRTGGRIPSTTSRAWIDAMTVALGDGASEPRRRQAAARAVAIGQSLGWTGPREGFANYAYGRLQIGNDAVLSLGAFNAARRAYSQSPITDIHAAHISVQLAAFTLIARDADRTVAITSPAIEVARRHENAALMALLMMFKAEALDIKGDTEAATALRMDSLGWGLYGFGDRDEVIDRLNEIASLAPPLPPT
jgi:hypothetical protein